MTSCCVQFAKFILIFINFIFFTMGAAIAGMAGYLLANGASLGFTGDAQGILTPGALYGCIFAGAGILVLSLVGCVSAMKTGCCGKMFLIVYTLIISVVILAELAGGAAVLVASGKIAAMNGSAVANKTTDETQKLVNDFVNFTYTKCCVGDKPNTKDVVCNYIDSQLGDAMCASQASFRTACITWLAKYTKPLGLGAIIIAAIELLCIGAACHISCHAKTPEQEQADEIKKQQEARQAQGGDLAYGGASGKPLAGSYA